MKKFAKILGFLGFFVTLATAQIGTAWADGAYCYADGYYGLGREQDDCYPCREHNEYYPNSRGGYNFSEDLCYQNCSGSCTDLNSSFQDGGTYGIPNESGFYIRRLNNSNSGTQNSLLNINGLTCDNIGEYCAEVFDCGKNACSANWKTINFVDHNNNQLGTLYIVYGMIWSTQQTTECNNCAQNTRNYAVFYPVFQTPTALPREGYTFLGYSDSQTGGSIRIEPYRDNMYGKLNYNNATNISGISGNTITLYARYSHNGCEPNHWYNSQTEECTPCKEGFTSPGGYYGQEHCTKTCEIDCTEQHAPEDECEAPLIGHYSPATFSGTEYEIDIPAQNIESGKCYDRNNNEITNPSDNSAYWCTWSCNGCSPAGCYELIEGACVPKKYIATYKCDGRNEYSFQDPTSGKPTYGESYNLFDVTSSDGPGACDPQPNSGQSFAGWVLDIDVPNQTVRTYPDSFEWKWCSDGNFTPSWTDTCYEVRFDDDTNGGHPNNQNGTHGPFYKKYNDPNHIWYSDNKCSEESKLEIGSGANQVNVIGHLPWKEHATFTGYYYETPTPNRQIFNANGNLTTGNNSGSDWTITDDTVLYAQYTCVDGYAPNANGDCVGDKIDVKYTCVSPVDGELDTHTFNDDATYGTAYPVKSVGTGNHDVQCAFTGYELDNDYVWNLQDYSGNSNNPNGEYGPGADAGSILLSSDWRYITTTPLTEIEFILNKSLWHLKTYNVEYRCGTINNAPVQGGPVTDSVTYNDPYFVAHDNILTDFLERCDETLGGNVSGYTLQDWTFTCDDQSYGNFNTGDPIADPNAWTYDSNNCYFTANWAQTDFVITLDSNIDQDPMNNGSSVSVPEELYTRLNDKVYSCPERTNSCEMGSLTAIPTKVVTVTLNGNGGQFTWNNETVPEATDDSKFTFLGFYESEESNSDQYIYGEDDANSGLITNRGKEVGIGYDGTSAPYTWYAHWENRDAVILTEPIERPGFTFNGWLCDHESVGGVDMGYYNNGTPYSYGISFLPTDNATCTAQWTEACYEIEFNDNGGTPSSNGTHQPYYKKHNDDKWYTNATCASVDYDPTVANNMPSKEHAIFTGYYDETLKIFAGTNDTPQGGLTSDGAAWTVTDNATLYAQYECDDLYHLMDDGSCGSCPGGSFYNPSSTNPNHCDTCADILGSNWTSKEGYTWSIDQCYRNCGTDGNDDVPECVAVPTPSGHGFEQFVVTGGGTGRQISFYGNEQQNIYTCRSATGATKCPLGLLDSENASGLGGGNRPMAAAVKFYNIANGETAQRYIIGNRAGGDSLSLVDGFAWSQVVGAGQQGPEITNTIGGSTETYRYTFITYPAETAPAAAPREHQTFAGYVYPENGTLEGLNMDPATSTGFTGNALTAENADTIIDFAKNLNPAQDDMSPNIQSPYSRNLWPIYTDDPTYTLTYSCGAGDTGTPPTQQTNIYAGDNVDISTPSNCSHYSTHSLTGWAVTATESGQNLGTVLASNTSITWNYTQDVTFTAVWGNANTHSIIYNKIPATDGNNITSNGNTLVRPNASTMPTQFECDNESTNITGQPQLKNSDGDVIGEVKQWCDNDDLSSECALPKTISHDTCTDKNVYAKWECTDSRYHLNETKDDCVACSAGEYWDENEGCKSCSLIGAGWTSKPGYNQSIDQCYRICNGSNGTSNVSCGSPDDLSYPGFIMSPIVSGENHQIEFYGNWRNRNNNPELDVCGADAASVTYCARIIRPLFTTYDANRLMSSKVTFKNNNNEDAGTRHLVGYTPAFVEDISNISFVNGNKIWSHIMGPGQYTTGSDGRQYVYAIYPTDTAPNPGNIDAQFMGYYDARTGGEQRVAAALRLDSNNAVAFPQGQLLENKIGDRILYPQYCANGETWNGQSCTGNAYTVKYVCGEHGTVVNGMSMQNTATYGQPYKVAYNDEQLIAQCQANEGYVLKTDGDRRPEWKLNNTDGGAQYVGYTGETIPTWNFTAFDPANTPTFTAQYDCDDGYTLDGTTCVLDSSNFHTITLDKKVGTLHGEDSNPTVLYTIGGNTTVYENVEHTEQFDRLGEKPKKYAYVKFHFCDGDNNSCERPSTEDVIKNAYFIFGGFYELHPDVSDRYISADGFITDFGGNVAAGLANDTTWYAVWNDYGTVAQSDWQSDPTPPSGYAFGGWYTAPNCADTLMTDNNNFFTDTELYACWSQNAFTVTYDCGIGIGGRAQDSEHPVSTNGIYNVLPNGTANGGVVTCNLSGQGFNGWKFSENTGVDLYNAGDTIPWQAGYGNETLTAQYRQCTTEEVLVNGVCYPKCEDKTCTIPNSQYDNECPDHDPQYPNDGSMHCTYSDPAIVQGYYIDNEHTTCLYANGANQGSPINEGYCPETPVCNPGYTWSTNPWGCIPDPNATYTIQFICEQNGTPITTPQTVHYGDSITVPSNSVCTNNPGYSYSQWEATQYSNPATLEAQNSTYQYTWEQTHDETFIADWNDGNVYHVNLHAYSCDDSTQTGTFGNSGVQELWEKYGVNWYRTNVGGTLLNPITELTTQQLPTRSGWTFGGYNTLGGDQRVRYANGAWNVSPTTLITEDEEWCAIWSQCNPNEYWDSGVCVPCNTATSGDFPLGDANATSIYQCYRQCSICTRVCPQTEGVDYCEYGDNPNMNGNLYYPGTGTCQPNYEQNCPITVLHCLPGYTPNGNNTACVPNSYMITLNSHIDGFNGHASSPEVLYTKYGPNGGAYLDSAYTYLMDDERSLHAVPEKSADVILNGNGGNVIWNGYSSSTATLTATFDFQGFYPSVYGGNQYISDTGYITNNGNTAAQQNQSNSTVWHAQWQEGSITLPDAQRQCYTFGGWWTDMYNGVSAGNANMPYTPTGATTNLYAHWTPGTYSITYHNGNAIYSGCSTTSYTFGNAVAINCSITPQAGSHKVFNGWCTNPELTAGCTQNPVISNTDCGDKDYYAWWGCESGYNLENGVCVPNASELCPARTLPNNAHATFVSGALNSNGTECIYTLKCEACTGCNNNNYTCYTHDNSTNNNGIFTVIGNIGDASVLNNVSCNATEYDVYYRCDGNSQGYAAQTKAVYGQAYSVEYNPHNNANGGQLNCQSDNQLFNGWTFNGNNQTYYPGTPNYMINSWNYCNITPIFTASYGQCPAGEVYVPSLGQCKEECYVPCKVPTNGACPNDFDLTPTSTGVHAYCSTYGGQAPNPQGPGYYLYPAPHLNEACLHVHTSNEITPQQCTDVSVVYCVDSNGTQSSHYTWDWDMHQCKPQTYRVTLTSNNGIEGSNFVNKLYEQYNVGWSRYLDGEFTSTLNLSQSELPTARETCKVFDGYWNDTTINRMINATGYLSLPATTLTDNTQVWNAHYVNDPNAYTITFQCSNGTVASTQYGVVFNQGNVTAPAMSLCPGEAFTQWVSGNVTLNAGTIYPNWQYCSNMTFTPDVSNSAVWEVTLLPGDGTFDSNDIRKLYDAVNVGWYTNSDLSEQSRITQIDNDKVPTKQGANFVGYKNQNGDWRVNYPNGSGWDLPRTNDLSGSETWTAQYNLCQAGYYYQDGQCKPCLSWYTSDPTTATQPEHCYVQCETCVEPACPSIPHSTGCEFDHNNNENYPGYLFYSQYGQNKCVKRTFNYNFTETIMCNWCAICDEANGWIRDPSNCQVCVPSWQSNGHTIDLNSLRMTDFDGDPTGDDVEPVRLYTWPDRGVYLDSGRTHLMTVGANGNNPVRTPTTYGVVRFDPNGGTFYMDGYTYTNRYGDRYVYANFRGFYNSQTGSTQYIDNSGHITQSGDDWGRTAEYDVTWYAKWQYGTIGELPTPTRLGYTFTGWYDSISGGNRVYEDTRVERSMNVYARWTKETYTITLNANNCQASATTLSKLYEQYDAGWARSQNDTFTRDLILDPSELPTPANSDQVFIGYYTSRNTGGDMMISANGTVIADPIYTSNQTWYARCVTNNGPFTVQFKCSANDAPIPGYDHTNVQYDDYINVPTVAQSGCSQDGATFTKWKASNHNIQINANVGSYQWSHHYGEVFTPDWNSEIYHVTLVQNDATQPGVTDLYEKYGMWWSQYQNGNSTITQLSGNALPRKTGFNFGGYENANGVTMGTYSSTTGVWTLPLNTTVTGDETWTVIWSECGIGEYWDGNKCHPCPGEFTDNPHAIGIEQCYGNCPWRCRKVGCPLPLPNGVESCTYENADEDQAGVIYNNGQTQCLPQGQQTLPQCSHIITCKTGFDYDSVSDTCIERNKYTIALDSHLYVNGTVQGTEARPSRLHTRQNTGVYISELLTPEYQMTTIYNPLGPNTPNKYIVVTLDGNGATFNWNNRQGQQISKDVLLGFDGFYESVDGAFRVIGQDRHITQYGDDLGRATDRNLTWHAVWNEGNVVLPIISRPGYEFAGWWTTPFNGGTYISMGDEPVPVSPNANVTWYARWSDKQYTVTYECGTGIGNSNTDSATYGQTYTIKDNDGNFISCSKPGSEIMGTPAAEFTKWKFSGNYELYTPGLSFIWNFDVPQPTFTAQYRNCVAGQYYTNNHCVDCPTVPDGETSYTSDPITAISQNNCYRTCPIECNRVCPNEDGVLGCVEYTDAPSSGTQYYGNSECVGEAQDCKYYKIMCKPGYTPDYYLSTDTGTHCTKLADHEITLAANCGQGTVIPGDQEKLYTTENTGVYLNPARTNAYEMRANRNPLVAEDLPRCIVTATFNHCDNNDPNCDGATIEQKTVDLGFNGYYKAETNGTRYTDKRQEDGQLKSYITQQGIDAGKGYTANATWFAQWLDGQVGSQKWPSVPTRIGTCGVTYEFVDWYTAANGGNVVPPSTPISEDVTWYAHWCESCPDSAITNGSCSDASCVARFTCNDGYYWNADNCSCVLSPDTRFTLTYKPNGGTPTQPKTQSLAYGETFPTLGGDTFTKSGEVLCRWDEENHASSNTFPDAVAELSTEYTYRNEENITLLAHWAPCQCTQGAAGVQDCSFSVVNNACVPTVTCMPGYIPNGTPTCAGECNATCDTSTSCRICSAGTYQDGNECKPCPDGFTSNAGATSCYGNTITIDWDENGGNAIPNGSCVYGQTFTLANAPSHSNSAMQFLGWKLFMGDGTYPAGTNVMCTYDNVGVYSGISHEIKAQWNECQCNYSEEDHVQGCWAIYTSGICMCSATCMPGYELIDNTYTCTPSCIPETYSEGITYKPNGGTPNRNYTQSVAYNATFTTFDWSVEHYTKAHHILAGWAVESGGVGTFDGTAALNETYTYHTDGPTSLLAKWTECANDEISFSTDNECHQCTCDAPNCNTYATDENKCACDATCPTGYTYDGCNCSGTVCEPICNKKQSDAIYVCGEGTTGQAPAAQTMNYGDTHTVKDKGNCSKTNHTFMKWAFTGDGDYHNPGDTVAWYYTEDKTFTGQWCENCSDVANGSCELGTVFAGSCSYDCSCEPGYRLVGDVCTANPVCEPDDSLTITYRPNGGMNNGVLGQPVIQNVTYGAGFITKPGTIFTKENSIITAWDHVEGGNYPELNHWYVYDTDIDTILDAHWEQCTCDADNCNTYATDENKCACSGTCPTGYTYGGCNCNGTDCAPICNKKQSDAIYVCGDDAGTPPATETMNYGDTHTVQSPFQPQGNCSKPNHTFMTWLFSGDGNYHNPGDTVAWYYTEDKTFTGQWCENCSDVVNGSCELGTVFAGSCQYTCSCEPGYKLVGDCNAHPVCKPDNTLAIHYKSNNGLNQTYNQPVTYGQSFVTEGGTRFTKVNNIMTQWKVENDATTTTFPTGIATLSGNYVYKDTTDTTLSAQWAQCTCEAGTGVASCETYSNANACDATVTCEIGYSNPQLNCNGTTCTATCTLGGSNAVYKCGTGIGAGYSTYVNYGATHTILTNAFVGCYRDNSTFAGWAFNGDNTIYFDNVGATVTWDYTTDKEFEARWCSNCPVVEHGTNLLTIPEPGLCRCDLTCDTGYHVENGACEPNVYPNENGITYKPNGGTPNRNYTQSVTYDAPFTTLGVVYSKARHILNSWDVESGGAGTFNGGYADLGREYIYKTDGATSLLAKWIECGINEISLDNQCQQCRCTDNNAGVTSCETSATNDDTCSCSGECAAGYINAGCNCNGTNCTQSCTKCADNQVSVNNVCEDCECRKNIDGIEGIISGCGFVSNNGNTCNWNPTTCRLGYGYPDLTCTETEHNNNCTASCTICDAGYYGPDGLECIQCPEGYTSLAGATSKKECFVDPNSCGPDEHIEHGECTPNVRACSIPDATSAVRIWNPAIGTYGPCTVEVDGCNSGYHVSGNVCVKDTEACTVEHGHGERDWNGTSWGACGDVVCDPGYEPNSDYTACVECSNRRVNGDIAVSGYIYECEIAACMYQGQKYALQDGECVPICEDASDYTGTKVWDERTKKCIRTCNPGYKMW